MGLYYRVRVLGTIMQVLYDNGTYGYVSNLLEESNEKMYNITAEEKTCPID